MKLLPILALLSGCAAGPAFADVPPPPPPAPKPATPQCSQHGEVKKLLMDESGATLRWVGIMPQVPAIVELYFNSNPREQKWFLLVTTPDGCTKAMLGTRFSVVRPPKQIGI